MYSVLWWCRFRTMVAHILLVGYVAFSAPPPNGGAPAAKRLAIRVLGPKAADLFTFHTLEAGACTSLGPCATVEQQDRVVSIGGTTPVEMAYALMIYCRNHLDMSFTWEVCGNIFTVSVALVDYDVTLCLLCIFSVTAAFRPASLTTYYLWKHRYGCKSAVHLGNGKDL